MAFPTHVFFFFFLWLNSFHYPQLLYVPMTLLGRAWFKMNSAPDNSTEETVGGRRSEQSRREEEKKGEEREG